MRRGLLQLIGGSLALWLLAAVPIRALGGDVALLQSGVALLLCLIPTSLTLAWTRASRGTTPEGQVLAVLGGTGLRMLFAIGGGMALYYLVPVLHARAFWFWVIVAYLVTLTLEVTLVVRQQAALEQAGPPTGDGERR